MLRHHARDEEDEQFPKLRMHVLAADLVEPGEEVEAAKKLAEGWGPHSFTADPDDHCRCGGEPLSPDTGQ